MPKQFLVSGTNVLLAKAHAVDDLTQSLKIFKMLINSLEDFDAYFGEYETYCSRSRATVPCDMYRFNRDRRPQDVVGVVIALIDQIIGDCQEGFGWQWQQAAKRLSETVGGDIPDIIIPTVYGRFFNLQR